MTEGPNPLQVQPPASTAEVEEMNRSTMGRQSHDCQAPGVYQSVDSTR